MFYKHRKHSSHIYIIIYVRSGYFKEDSILIYYIKMKPSPSEYRICSKDQTTVHEIQNILSKESVSESVRSREQ